MATNEQHVVIEFPISEEERACAVRLDELQRQHGKIGVVEFGGHVIVFKRPSRAQAREYRRVKDTAAEAPDALDRLAQMTIVAFDDETDPNKARITFTQSFLEDYPLATSNPRFVAVLSAMSGIVDDEEARDMGKGARIKGLSPPVSPKV